MAIWRDRRRADLGGLALMSRRFPPPWSVDIVRDVNGQALAYVYYEQERIGQTASREHRQAAGTVDEALKLLQPRPLRR